MNKTAFKYRFHKMDHGVLRLTRLRSLAQDKFSCFAEEFAFTLVELLIVLAIIAVLVGITIAGIGYVNMRSRNSHRLTAISNVEKAFIAFYDENGYYPASASYTFGEVLNTFLSVYMEGSWEAPAGTSIYYRVNPQSTVFIVCVNQEEFLSDDELYNCKGTGIGFYQEDWPRDSAGLACRDLGAYPNCGSGPFLWNPETESWD